MSSAMALLTACTRVSTGRESCHSPKASIRPVAAASAAVMRPMPSSQNEAVAQNSFDVAEKARSDAKVKQSKNGECYHHRMDRVAGYLRRGMRIYCHTKLLCYPANSSRERP